MWEKKEKNYQGEAAFVLDKRKKPLTPTTRQHAVKLVNSGRARIHKHYPFTIRIVDVERENLVVKPVALKLDIGAKATGGAMTLVGDSAGPALWLINAELDAFIRVMEAKERRNFLFGCEAAQDRIDEAQAEVEKAEALHGFIRRNEAYFAGRGLLSPTEADQAQRLGVPLQSLLPAAPAGLGPGCGIAALQAPLGPAWSVPQRVVALFELQHRGEQIHLGMIKRSAHRRRRRSANLRYRKKRFNNRKRKEGWLPPSIRHRVETVESLVKKLMRLAPIRWIVLEDCKFDAQAIENPEIYGAEYQQGDLCRREAMEFLLDKWGRQCVYCGAGDRPLQRDHVVPRSKGGSDRVSNLVVACAECNQRKGGQDLRDFLRGKPGLLKKIESGLKAPLNAAAAMNWVLAVIKERLKALGLPVICASAAATKHNRKRFGVDKTHAVDAACAGPMSSLEGLDRPVLAIISVGHGKSQREQMNRHGFPNEPRTIRPEKKRPDGFATGDFVEGTATKGLYKGVTHVGRMTMRSNGQFYIKGPEDKKRKNFSLKNTKLLQRGDGYDYYLKASPLMPK